MQVLSELKKMTPERFLSVYQSLETKGYGPLDAEVAKSIKFRYQAVRKLPMATRAKRARMLIEGSSNAELAYELLGAYLLKNHKGLVTGFLDKTGVKHEDGLIENIHQGIPQREKIAEAVTELDKEFPAEDVTIYISMCAQQWNEVPELDLLWQERTA